MWKQIMNWYNTKPLFQSFVQGIEGAMVSALAAWTGGIPANKAAWISLGAFVGKALYGWGKRWLQQNVATVGVVTK